MNQGTRPIYNKCLTRRGSYANKNDDRRTRNAKTDYINYKNSRRQNQPSVAPFQIESSKRIQELKFNAEMSKQKMLESNKHCVAEIDQNQSNFIFLKSVEASINLKDYELIEISSNFGKYNVNNYDTIFSKNVIISYLDNKIKGDYLDFSLDKKLMIVSKDVIIKNNRNSLQADVIEVDIETKDLKIFMYEEDKKVNFKSLN